MTPKTEQQLTLSRLLDTAGATEFGKKYHFDGIRDYAEYAEQLPIHFYHDIQPYIDRLKKGEADILWPGSISKYAVSAGTTGMGKHLPLSEERLATDREFMKSAALSYFKQRRNPLRLLGKHMSLPGTVEKHNSIQIGEISGFSALQSPLWLQPFQLVKPSTLSRLTFREKFDLLLERALETNLKVISAVPSWILTFFQQALKKTGASEISGIWPNLALLVCGGVKLSNYRGHLEKLLGGVHPDFLETYGASEGYFAFTDDLHRNDLRLMTDNGIFYEFIKDPLPDEDAMAIQDTLPLWEVEPNTPYAVVVSTNAGLWRYALRDIIEFTSVQPPRIKVRGRVSEMLDDYGEGLYIFEAEEALDEATEEMGLHRTNFAIIPRLVSEFEIPHHLWLIQFATPIHTDTLKRLAISVDQKLRSTNRHYAIRRESKALGRPRVNSISQADVNRWMEASNKAKAQGKLPKIIRENVEILF